MPTRSRTYWLTEPCRIRREGGSLRIERPDHTPVRIPITDVRDLVAFDHVDLNTSAVSLLGRHGWCCTCSTTTVTTPDHHSGRRHGVRHRAESSGPAGI